MQEITQNSSDDEFHKSGGLPPLPVSSSPLLQYLFEKNGVRDQDRPQRLEDSEVQDFETRHKVSFPPEQREFIVGLGSLDVTGPGLVNFKALGNMRFVESLPDFLVLADVQIEAYQIAIQLGADAQSNNRVFSLDESEPEKKKEIASSFSEFVSAYIKDPDSL